MNLAQNLSLFYGLMNSQQVVFWFLSIRVRKLVAIALWLTVSISEFLYALYL